MNTLDYLCDIDDMFARVCEEKKKVRNGCWMCELRGICTPVAYELDSVVRREMNNEKQEH